MTSTILLIPAEHMRPEMGELSDIARQLASRYSLQEIEPGTYQFPTFQLKHAPAGEGMPESLTYWDNVCRITLQHIPEEDIRQAHYTVAVRYLEGQLNLLRKSNTVLGKTIAEQLQHIKEIHTSDSACQFHTLVGLRDFSETKTLLEDHINA